MDSVPANDRKAMAMIGSIHLRMTYLREAQKGQLQECAPICFAFAKGYLNVAVDLNVVGSFEVLALPLQIRVSSRTL